MISIEALLCRITPLQAYLPFILVMFCHWAEQHCLPEKLSTPETRKLVVGHGLHSEQPSDNFQYGIPYTYYFDWQCVQIFAH